METSWFTNHALSEAYPIAFLFILLPPNPADKQADVSFKNADPNNVRLTKVHTQVALRERIWAQQPKAHATARATVVTQWATSKMSTLLRAYANGPEGFKDIFLGEINRAGRGMYPIVFALDSPARVWAGDVFGWPPKDYTQESVMELLKREPPAGLEALGGYHEKLIEIGKGVAKTSVAVSPCNWVSSAIFYIDAVA